MNPLATKETTVLKGLKAEEINCDAEKVTIEPWDFKYYHRILEEKNDIDTNKVREYFEFNRVTREMLKIYEETLGIAFKKVTEDGKALWHSDVELFQVNERASEGSVGDLIGHFYLDLFPRDGKYSHAACFDLQPGFSFINATKEPKELFEETTFIEKRQYPCAVMVANFSKPTADRPSLLDHNEVTTYFHELGHVMHTLLSKTKYSRFHGCSVEGDFVEAPSQMLENWCYNSKILQQLGRHYLNESEALPTHVILALNKSKLIDIGLLTLRQIFFGRFDFFLHSADSMPSSVPDMIKGWKRLRQDVMGIKEPEDLKMFGGVTFTHLTGGYDAGYYGYLWSLVVSADMFYSKFLDPSLNNVISTAAGLQYRKEILQPGASRDATESIKAFLGRDSNNRAFMKFLGLE